MLFYVLALLVLYVSMTTKKQTLPNTPSHLVYNEMVERGDNASLFMELETEFISAGSVGEAVELSTLIKETFPDYDFGYHTEMIKNVSYAEHASVPSVAYSSVGRRTFG